MIENGINDGIGGRTNIKLSIGPRFAVSLYGLAGVDINLASAEIVELGYDIKPDGTTETIIDCMDNNNGGNDDVTSGMSTTGMLLGRIGF